MTQIERVPARVSAIRWFVNDRPTACGFEARPGDAPDEITLRPIRRGIGDGWGEYDEIYIDGNDAGSLKDFLAAAHLELAP
jgi:hypothetical protein